MYYVLAPLRVIYKIWFGISFFIFITLVYPFLWALTRTARNVKSVHIIHKYMWMPFMQICLLIWIRRHQKSKIPPGPYIICANHTSYLDIVFMPAAFRGYFLFMGKAELARWPLLNVLFKNGNMHISVNRKNKFEAARSLKMAEKRLDEGYSVMIFPEGTIPRRTPFLHKFKSGAFKLAIEKGIPVLPVTFTNNWHLMSEPDILFGPAHPGISHIYVHEPVATTGMSEKDVVSLQKKVFEIIESDLRKYSYPKAHSPWHRPPKKRRSK